MQGHSEVDAALTGIERYAYRWGRLLNETRLGKRVSGAWGSAFSVPWLGATIRPRYHIDGLEHLPARSIIVAANHRTFFDLYAVMIAIWNHLHQSPYLYCPVRSNYFYDHPLGPFLNTLVSGNAMYPPIFRDDRGPVLNRSAVDACVRLLDWQSRVVIAMHPEGTRSSNPDPYDLLPAKPGVGRIALRSRAPVLPIFVNGLPRTFGRLVKERFTQGVEPVRVMIGAPVMLDDLYDRAEEPAAAKEAAQRTLDAIRAQGERDRAFMTTWRPGTPTQGDRS